MDEQSLIPPSKRATAIPPPDGLIPAFLYRLFGPSWRTTLSGIGAAIAATATAILALCPKLQTGVVDKHEMIVLTLTLVSGGALVKAFSAAKDKSVTGVEK